MITQYIVSCLETLDQLKSILDPKPDNPTISMQRLIDYLTALNGGSRQGYIKVYTGPTQSTASIIFNGQPTVGQTIRILRNTYTVVASGATGLQFNLGASTLLTAQNLMNTLNNTSSFVGAAKVVQLFPTVPILTITCLNPGTPGIGFTMANTLTNVTATPFSLSTWGTIGAIATGLNTGTFGYQLNSIYNLIECFIITDDSLPTLLSTLNIQNFSPNESLTRLTNFHQSLGFTRSGYVSLRIGATNAIARLTFSGNPVIGNTITINGQVFTGVDTPANDTQFRIGSTMEETMQNIADTITNNMSYNRVSLCVGAEVVDNVVNIYAFFPGAAGSQYLISRVMPSATLSNFSGGSDGTIYNLNFGYDGSVTYV